MTITTELAQELRERYTPKHAPKCHICGSQMSIQRAGGGSLTYGCDGRIDTDNEGYQFAEGRGFADDHYAKSRVTIANSGDDDVIALLDALDAKDKQIAEVEAQIGRAPAGYRLQPISEFDAMCAAQLEARTEQQPVMYQYREHNHTNGMKTAWETVDADMHALLVADTDQETAEFRPLYTAPPAPAPVTVKVSSLNPEMFNADVMFGYRKARMEDIAFCAASGIKIAEGE